MISSIKVVSSVALFCLLGVSGVKAQTDAARNAPLQPRAVTAQPAQGAPAASEKNSTANYTMLRIACEGPAVGAEVTINGIFKGECPIDVTTPAGTILLRVHKKFGLDRESAFEQQFRMAPNTVKRIDVEMGSPVLTAEGRRAETERVLREQATAERLATIEKDRIAREKAEADHRIAERQQAALSAMLEAEKAADLIATQMLAESHASQASGSSDCYECPAPPSNNGVPIRLLVPSAADATINDWLAVSKQEASAYLARNGLDFTPPAQAAPMPCESAAARMRELAHIVSMRDKSALEQDKFRNASKNFAANRVSFFRDVKLWPVVANCADGQLTGPLDFWASSVSVDGVDSMTMVSRDLQRVRTVMGAGKQIGPMSVIKVARNLTRFKDPESEARMKDTKTSKHIAVTFNTADAASTGTHRGSVIYLPIFDDAATRKLGPHSYTSFAQPGTGGRSEDLSYSELTLTSRSAMKAGQKHGPTTVYIGSPPTTYCYRDGELVKLNPCNVD